MAPNESDNLTGRENMGGRPTKRQRGPNKPKHAESGRTPATGTGVHTFAMPGALTKELIGIYRKAAAANPNLSETQVINGFLGELQPILTAVPIR